MIIDTMSVDELRDWVKSHCVLVTEDFYGSGFKLNAGEWYEGLLTRLKRMFRFIVKKAF